MKIVHIFSDKTLKFTSNKIYNYSRKHFSIFLAGTSKSRQGDMRYDKSEYYKS